MKKALWFYILYGVFLLTLGVVILLNEKATLHELLTIDWIAKCNATLVLCCDYFFKYITEIGSSIPFVVAGIYLFVNFGDALFLLLSQLAVTLVVQPIKHAMNMPRPKTFFATTAPDVVLHQVNGVDMHAMLSFPSGHTASAFAFLLAMALICKRTWLSVLFLLLAVLAGYSRIYLSQHFAEDVFAGSLVGVLTTTLLYWIYIHKPYKWQEYSFFTIFKSKNK